MTESLVDPLAHHLELYRKHQHTCQRCGKGWTTRLEIPCSCRFCRSALWNQPRVRKPGAGRKPNILRALDRIDAILREAEAEDSPAGTQ